VRDIDTIWGTFRCFDGDSVGNALAKGEFWDAHLQPFMHEAAGEGTALDIGAYIGFHSVYLSHLYPTVVAIEPQPASYLLLVENCRHTNVILLNLAAYSELILLETASTADVGWDPAHPTNAPAAPLRRSDSGKLAGRPLDDLYLKHVDFIKIDAQGCDLRALIGLEQTIARCRPLIVFEWEAQFAQWHGDSWADVERWAIDHQYRLERIVEGYSDHVARPL
jgi:FkbM family methyltransferase